MKKISIISPCFNEELNVMTCYEAVKNIFETELQGYEREHIFADNCSTDATIEVLKKIAERDKQVKVIVNSRNYGVIKSTFNALKSATGDAIVPMLPVDLQDPPEEIPKFVREWEKGTMVVYGTKYERDESFIMKNIRRLYYILLSKMARIKIPKYAGEFQVIDKSILAALMEFDDYYPFIRGMIANVSSSSKGIPYKWVKRKIGKSRHNFYELYDQGINGIISFSAVPLRLMILLGVMISVFSFLFVILQICMHIFYAGKFITPGMSTAIVGIFFFFGIQFLFLGLLGEYVAAIHSQVRRGPLVIEKERINFT